MEKITVILLIVVGLYACRKKGDPPYDSFKPTPYDLKIPDGFPKPSYTPQNNPLTLEGIELGRHLFYDTRMSIDQSIACADCHSPSIAFSDSIAVSPGVNGRLGTRNAMPLFNLAWYPNFMWDGAGATLVNQVLIPLTSHFEMNVKPDQIPDIVDRFQSDPDYVAMYKAAFGSTEIRLEGIQKALEQFELSLISADSKYDKWVRGEIPSLSTAEMSGLQIYSRTDDGKGSGECIHCHSLGGNFADGLYRNNGLDENPIDSGRGRITSNPLDLFKFKVPSLRNLIFTAPYMHDGRFETIDQVLEFYNTGLHINSPNIDANLVTPNSLIGRLDNQEKAQLKAFLLTLTDSSFVTNPRNQSPF